MKTVFPARQVEPRLSRHSTTILKSAASGFKLAQDRGPIGLDDHEAKVHTHAQTIGADSCAALLARSLTAVCTAPNLKILETTILGEDRSIAAESWPGDRDKCCLAGTLWTHGG